MRKSFFLVSVSNKKNLELCKQYCLAGFMNNISGVWTFTEIREGDLISFLYGARAHNLYLVKKKEAISKAESAPPWQPITFQQSGKTYNFPFRLQLQPLREFEEPLVRAEFAYVAENLLLRGGYRRTHFQADQTTLQAASQMGVLWNRDTNQLEITDYPVFTPHFTRKKEQITIPEVFQFHEFILQSLIRNHLCVEENLGNLLNEIGVNGFTPKEFEVLGEKALPEGHVDILVKEATPIGVSRKIIIEVKTGAGTKKDLGQLRGYAEEIGNECIAAILVARNFSPMVVKTVKDKQIKLVSYALKQLDNLGATYTFEELLQDLILKTVQA